MKKLKLFFACLLMAVLSIGQVWATTYKLTKVTSVETGKLYVFERNSHVFNNTSASSALQTTATYKTTGLEGTESYVWTLETATGGFYLKNVSLASNQYLNNASKTTVSFGAASSIWTIAFTGEVALISNTSNSNRFLGDAGKDSPNNTYKAYATGNLSDYEHDITVYVLDEEGGTPVTPVSVTGVTLNKSELELEIDESETLTATVAPGDATDKSVSWSSDDESVATVANGVVTAVAEGTATITVTTTDGSYTATCDVTVTAAAPAVEYIKVTGDIEEGDYVIYYGGKVVKNVVASNRLSYEEVTPVNDKIKNPADAIVWHIAPAETEGYWTIYNADVQKYVVCTGSNNQANLNASATANAVVSVSEVSEGSYDILSKARQDASSNNYYLRNNGTYGFAFYGSGTGGALTLYKNSAAPAVAQPTISGETPFLNSTNVTISIPDGATVYYTTDDSTPTDASNEYSVPFALNNSATVKAIAKIGSDYSSVAEKAFTKATVMTVAEARAAIDAGGDLSNKFVAGIISQIDSYNSTYKSITYWISDDGTTTDQLQVYSGLAGIVKAEFASVEDLNVGDDVTVKGTLKKYSSTYEFDKNNTIEAYKPIARLSWSAESFDAALEGENTFPSLTNTNGVTVSYSSSDPTKASFADASVYEITLNAAGLTTITATFAGNETYKANSASYTLNVASSLVTLTYNVDGGEAIEPVNVSALPNPLPTTTKAGKNFGGWFTDPEKEVAAVPGAAISENTTLYAKWLDPYTVAEAKAVIDANPSGIENQYVAGIISQIDSYNGTYHSITYWISADGTTTNQLQVYGGLIGNAATALGKDDFSAKEDLELGDEVVVTGTLKLHNSTTYEFDKNNTIYSFNRPVVPVSSVELASAATVKVGNSINLSASVLPANATDKVIEWSIQSGNDNITLDNGAVTGVAEGTAVVRATSHADNTKYAECTITIEAADPTYAYYFYGKVTETAGIEDGQYLIVYEDESVAFNGGLETLDAAHNTIAVEIEDGLIVSNVTTDAASFTIGVTAGTIQAAMGDYIGVTSYSNGLKQNADATTYPAHSFSIDEEGNAIVSLNNGWSGTMILNYNIGTSDKRFRYYKDGSQKKIQLYKRFGTDVAPKANPQLAWDPAEDIEITVGDEFTAPTLTYVEGFDGVAAVAIESDNTDLAIVTAGVVSLVADATGEANITATFAGNDNYKAATASYKITVNASVVPPTPAVSGNVVIIAEYESKFYAMTNSLASGALAGVEVEKDGSKIVVSSAEDKAAIQWTATVTGENTTFQDGESKYLAHTGSGTNLMLADDAENWTFDSENGCYSAVSGRAFFFYNTSSVFKNYSISSNLGKPGYSGAPEVIEIDPDDIVITSKVDPQLAYSPASDEITVGDAWSAPALGYVEGFDGLEAILYESSNEAVATVSDAGVIALAGGTGTATITATFGGNASYLAGSATYTVKVNEVPDNCDATDDFSTANSSSPTSYTTRTTTAGWSATNAGYKVIEDASYLMINGKTTAVGVITSPVLSDGIASLKFRYANTNNESNGVSVRIDIKQGTEVVKTYTLTKANSEVTKDVVYTEIIENINVAGEFQIIFTNLSPSNNTGNADRVSIGRLCWENYSAPEPPVVDWVEVRTGLEVNRHYTVCLEKNITNIDGATFWSLDKRNEAGTLAYLEEEIAPEAGKPYIIQATKATLKVVYGEETAVAPVDNGALRGTFDDLDAAALNTINATGENDVYMLFNNELRPIGTNNHLDAHRAYVLYNELQAVSADPVPAPGRNIRKMPMQKDQAQGFESIEASEKPMKLMIDGKMYILRGEKMYDATGRLVK